MGIGVAQGVGASAVFLLVEMFAFADFNHARAAAAFAPVEVPVHNARIVRGGAVSAIVDLRHIFPARNAQRAADDFEAVFVRVQSGALETHIEAHGAADAAFGFVFHAFGALEPVVHVVIGVDKGHAVFFGKGDVFVFAQLVFFERVDVGIVEINGVVDAAGKHGFHHFTAARGAARMQQHFFVAAGRNQHGTVNRGNFGFVHNLDFQAA